MRIQLNPSLIFVLIKVLTHENLFSYLYIYTSFYNTCFAGVYVVISQVISMLIY